MLACIRFRNFDYVGIQDALASVQTGTTVKARLAKIIKRTPPPRGLVKIQGPAQPDIRPREAYIAYMFVSYLRAPWAKNSTRRASGFGRDR